MCIACDAWQSVAKATAPCAFPRWGALSLALVHAEKLVTRSYMKRIPSRVCKSPLLNTDSMALHGRTGGLTACGHRVESGFEEGAVTVKALNLDPRLLFSTEAYYISLVVGDRGPTELFTREIRIRPSSGSSCSVSRNMRSRATSRPQYR